VNMIDECCKEQWLIVPPSTWCLSRRASETVAIVNSSMQEQQTYDGFDLKSVGGCWRFAVKMHRQRTPDLVAFCNCTGTVHRNKIVSTWQVSHLIVPAAHAASYIGREKFLQIAHCDFVVAQYPLTNEPAKIFISRQNSIVLVICLINAVSLRR
jgi:hypothetical protein